MLSLVACLYLRPALAVPLPNVTIEDTGVAPSWVDDPSGRGTWNLLYSCGFTLVLCVWTSIHLNVPPPCESAWLGWRRKLKWVVIALFAPEIVVFTAFQQWFTARFFLKELKNLRRAIPAKNSEAEASQTEYPFDMAYAHYAVMGGFAVKVDDLHNTLDRATLTTNGILLLAQHGHCFTLSKEAISDKSKANYLAKGLVCVQVLWVAGQAIERKVAGFPISLLEFHTLVHVFCAIVMYMLWFRKPYDINEPTVVPTEDFPNALAFIVASSRWAGASGFQKISDFRSRDWEDDFYSRWVGNQDPKFMFFGKLKATPQTWISKIDKYAKSRGREVPLEMNDDRIRNHFVRLPCDSNHKVGNSEGLPYIPCPKEVELRKAKREKGTFITARDFEPPWFPGETVEKSFKPANGVPEVLALQSGQALNSGLGPNINLYGRPGNHGSGVRMGLSQKDLNRLSMAGNFIQELLDGKDDSGFQINSLKPSYQDITKTPFNPFKAQRIRPYGESLINQRQSNFFDLQELTDAFDHFGKRGNLYLFTLLALAVIAIPAAYGAIHLSAINSLFPTEIELTLWKSSCFILLGFAGLMIAGIVGYVALLRFEVAWRMLVPRWLEDAASVLFGISVAIAIILVSLLYIGARLFIVIESFISLRHVPVGVYLTPDTNFMSYIPHL